MSNSNSTTNSDDLPTIVVTGFGLFRDYLSNPSWECVKRLRLKNVKLVIQEIAVSYETVDSSVAQIWRQYKPLLVVHCGVSCLAKCITLETRAARDQSLYTMPDVFGRLPDRKQVNRLEEMHQKCRQLESNDSNDSNECIECEINLKNVCERVNKEYEIGSIGLPAVLSSSAGRYLCEYIYSSSLKASTGSTGRTAFIHVPEICDNRPLEVIASALELTIQALIQEVLDSNKSIAD